MKYDCILVRILLDSIYIILGLCIGIWICNHLPSHAEWVDSKSVVEIHNLHKGR